jgi:hypothetical protein
VNTAIYYPHFYPSENWLRLGALLWDRIYTMQLQNTAPAPWRLHELNEQLGGVWAIAHPFDQEMASTGVEEDVFVPTEGPPRWDKMFKVWVTPKRRERQIVQRPVTMSEIARSDDTVQRFAHWLDLRSERLSKQVSASLQDHEVLSGLTGLSGGKFSGQGPVLQLLEDRGLLSRDQRGVTVEMPEWEVPVGFEGVPGPPAPGSDLEQYESLKRQAARKHAAGDTRGYEQLSATADQIRQRNLVTVEQTSTTYYLPKDVALHYLSLCADRLAQLGKRDVVTDQRQFTETFFDTDEELRGQVAAAVLEAYVPEGLATVDPARIAECRAQLSANRLSFQAEVQNLVQTFGGVASVDTYETVKSQLVDMAKQRIEQTRTTYRKARLDVTVQALNVSLTPPALATAAASALHIGLLAPVGLSAVLSLFAASKVIEWRNARSEQQNSPWSYVLDVSRKLG